MRRLRIGLLAIIAWLFLVYNIERLTEPINIDSFVYVLIAMTALANLGWRRLRRAGPRWSFLVPLAVYFPLKLTLGHPILGTSTALPLAVTEVVTLWLTSLFARQIGLALDEFEAGVTELTIHGIGASSFSFAAKQDEMYSEVGRARRFKRPLTLVVFKADKASVLAAIPRIVQEVQQRTMEQFVLAKVARLLHAESMYPSTLAQDREFFYMLLPEIPPEKAPDRATALARAIRERLNVDLEVGMANFPDQALTFEALVSLAKANLSSLLAATSGESAEPMATGMETVEAVS